MTFEHRPSHRMVLVCSQIFDFRKYVGQIVLVLCVLRLLDRSLKFHTNMFDQMDEGSKNAQDPHIGDKGVSVIQAIAVESQVSNIDFILEVSIRGSTILKPIR